MYLDYITIDAKIFLKNRKTHDAPSVVQVPHPAFGVLSVVPCSYSRSSLFKDNCSHSLTINQDSET